MKTKPPESRGVPPKLLFAAAGLLLLLVPWAFLEGMARSRATSGCVTDFTPYADAIQQEVRGSGGTPVTVPRLAAVLDACRARGAKVLCPETGARYVLGTSDERILARGLAVWDGAPHGFFLKFRGVVRTDGTIARISEGEFQKLSAR